MSSQLDPRPVSHLIILFQLLAAFFQYGCETQSATTDRRNSSKPLDKLEEPGKIEKVPFKTFDIRSTKGSVPLGVEVRLAKPVEVSKVWPESTFSGLLEGVGTAGAGIGTTLLNPMAQGAALGGIILFPAIMTLGYINQKDRDAILRAFQETDLPTLLKERIRTRLSFASSEKPDEAIRLEVVILGYGLIGEKLSDWRCFAFDAEIRLSSGEQILYDDRLLLEPFRRSLDAPPSRCAMHEDFGAENARLVRETLQEAAEVVSFMVTRRLGVRP